MSAAGLPVIDANVLVERVRADFGVSLTTISQVPGGQDSDAVLMRGLTVDNTPLAVKVSRSERVSGLLVPAHLASGIVTGIATPLRSHSGTPYSFVGGGTISLTPWISGRTAYESGMNADQWRRFGALVSQVHAAQLPPMVADRLDTEDYRTCALAVAADLHERICGSEGGRHVAGSADPLTVALTRDWQSASDSIALLVAQTEDLGEELRAHSRATVVCHGDAHIGNVMLGENGEVWLLDWDGAVLAPRDRDLMFMIGGVLADAQVTTEQQQWFFEGYGHSDIDPIHLAYYRCSWAVQDLADFAARILDHPAGQSSVSSQALSLFRSVLGRTGIVQLALNSLREIGRTSRA